MSDATTIHHAIAVMEQLKGCPCCGNIARQTCPDEDGNHSFRNIDDHIAKRFDCGSEFSVDEDGDIISRVSCPSPSQDAASALCDARDDLVEAAA